MPKFCKHVVSIVTAIFVFACCKAMPGRADIPKIAAAAPRLEGTITSIRNGISVQAKLKFEAPDSLRIDSVVDGAAMVEPATIVATGAATLSFDPTTRRIVSLPYNIARQPWRADDTIWGGAAGLAIFGLDPSLLAASYDAKTVDGKIDLTAKPGAGHEIQDYARMGSDRSALFYAVYKRRVWGFPQHIQLTLKNGRLDSMTAVSPSGQIGTSVIFEYDAANLPRRFVVSDASGRVTTEFKFDLKQRDAVFAADTFAVGDAAKDQIVEDGELAPISAYQGKTDPASVLNLGTALVRHTEDYPSAFRDWQAALKQRPSATAPLFDLFDGYLAVRDLDNATTALDELAHIMGEENIAVLSRRAEIAILRHDWPTALASLDKASVLRPQDLSLQLSRAALLRSTGQLDKARSALLAIVASDLPQPGSEVAAANMLAESIWSGSLGDEVVKFRDSVPTSTRWQKLTRALLGLWVGQKVDGADITDPLAKAALAVAFERERQDDSAIKIWSGLATLGSDEVVIAAAHLELLYARRGNAQASYAQYRVLNAAGIDLSARDHEAEILGEAWRKNFRGAELRATLEGHVISPAATSLDLNTWVIFLDNYGTFADSGAALRSAVVSFDDDARWHSRYAEQLLSERGRLGLDSATEKATVFKQAIGEIEQAVQLDPDQPYYLEQEVLANLQLSGELENGAILNPEVDLAQLKATADSLDRLEATFSGDPDAALLVSLGRQELADKGDGATIDAIGAALEEGLPGRETLTGDRHATVFFGRQAVALSYAKFKRWPEAEKAYSLLSLSAKTATEELGVTLNKIAMWSQEAGKENGPDPEAIAGLFERAVSDHWSYADSQMLLQNYCALALRDASRAAKLAAILGQGNAARQIAGAQLTFALEKVAATAADAPDAPPVTDRFLREVQNQSSLAVKALQGIAAGADKELAARADAGLAERSLNANDLKPGIAYLRSAIELDPTALPLRTALVKALLSAGQNAEAESARNDILERLPRDAETLRIAADLSLQLGLAADAARLASEAQSMMQTSRDASPAALEVASFVLARALMANGQKDVATDLYKKLAADQWDLPGRTAALLDWERELRGLGPDSSADADAVAAQLDDLKPSKNDTSKAGVFLDSLDS